MRRSLSLLLLSISALLWASPASSLTLTQLRTEARTLALDTGASRQRFSDARINAFLNEGQRVVFLDSKPVVKFTSAAVVVNTTYYAMPSDFFQPYRVSFEFRTITEQSLEALDKNAEWYKTSGYPTFYFMNWSSRTYMGVYPFPTTTASTGTLRVEYYAQATTLSSDSDVPFNSITELVPYHYTLAFYAASRMAAIDGRADLATFYMAEFRAGVDRVSREARARPSYRPSAIGGPP